MIHVFDNAFLFNPCTGEWLLTSFSVENGIVAAIGANHSLTGDQITDLGGSRVIPGLIDTHLHIESTFLVPQEFGRVALAHGVTTAIADPHEIANVAGTAGIDFMLQDAQYAPNDIFFMLPSCVPATAEDVGGAVLTAADLAKYSDNPRVLGLGEMMNFPGVLADDPEVLAKLSLFSHVDGHAPGLVGTDLCRYAAHGIKTDHECTSAEEAREKLRCGMYILLREGEAARDVEALSSIVDASTVSRCCFCTDDRHVDTLVREGSIDHCIRTAIAAGMPENLALRMATLSAAECFGLTDRGVIAPGRVADFCILADTEIFTIQKVYKNGIPADEIPISAKQTLYQVPPFSCRIPTQTDLSLPENGTARVIGIIPGELVTENIPARPDADGVQKLLSIDRYHAGGFAIGLVKGFGMQTGAVASSIAHDAHNIIATGKTDEEILTAIRAVADAGGGLAVVTGKEITLLSLPIGGLMTYEPADSLLRGLDTLSAHLKRTGACRQTFGYLSFLSLTVIPHLKLTPRGLFDVDAFETVPLFH